jgi:hypothetical protein
MIKRVTWFAAGAAAGAVGMAAAGRTVKRKAAELTPVNVARNAASRVKARGSDVAAAVREGRTQAKAKEAELRAVRDGRAPAGIPGLTEPAPPGTIVNVVVLDPRQVPGLDERLDEVRAAKPAGPRRTARRPR